MALIWKKSTTFDLLFTYFSHQGKTQTFIQHIFHLHKYTYLAHPIDSFALPNLQKYKFIMYGFSLVRLLVLILIRASLELSINNKMVSKI